MKTAASSHSVPTLGQRLRKERLARGWSVKHAAEQIRSSDAVVRWLESDAVTELAGVYRDAYLKRYLELLNIDGADMGESNVPALQVVLPLPKRRYWLERSVGWARYALASLIIVPPLVWFSIHHSTSWIAAGFNEKSDSQPRQVLAPSVRHLQASQIPTRALSTSASGDVVETGIISGDVPAKGEGIMGASETVVSVLNVYLTEDSWVELIDSRGHLLEHDLLRADREYSYQGSPPFEVLVGLGSGVVFELDGQVVDHLDSAQFEGLMAFNINGSGQVTQKQ